MTAPVAERAKETLSSDPAPVTGASKAEKLVKPKANRPKLNSRLYTLGSVLVVVVLAGLWQLVGIIDTREVRPGQPFFPGWQIVLTDTVTGLADYWRGGLGVESVSAGGERTYIGGLLAIVSHGWDTMMRIIAGLLIGAVIGSLVALVVSGSVWGRRLFAMPTAFLRTFPLLGLIPMFQLWFGTAFAGAVTFIAVAVGVIFFTGVVNAVANADGIYVQNAKTLGARPIRTYVTVVLPSILPEMRSTIQLSLAMAWTAAIASEFVGAQSGLGYIVTHARYFGFVDRMFLIGIVVVIMASLTYYLVSRVTKRLVVWMPDAQG